VQVLKLVSMLNELAQRWGVQNGYHDIFGKWHHAQPEALWKVLIELGAPLGTFSGLAQSEQEIETAINAHDQLLFSQVIEPILVVNAHEKLGFVLRLDRELAVGTKIFVEVHCEDGTTHRDQISLDQVPPYEGIHLAGHTATTRFVVTNITNLAVGYHEAHIEVGGRQFNPLVLAPPPRLPSFATSRQWGVFAPLYALAPTGAPGTSHLGVANLSDLDRLGEQFQTFGATVVSTLPLLATYLSEPYEPSPYSPLSRRWWSELYLDPAQLPGLAEAPQTARLLASARVRRQVENLAANPLVQYREAAALVHATVDSLIAETLGRDSAIEQRLQAFRKQNPELEDYAWFRAAVEQHGIDAVRHRAQHLRVDEALVRRYEYFQLAADTQLRDLAASLRGRGQILALDLPLGANPNGYDVWSNPQAYAEVATGAPPDALFSGGQNWGFPPAHPIRSRQNRYVDFIGALRHHFRYAGLLRIDHLMSLERLWWIPPGYDAKTGVYVRYPSHELMAIVAIEAWRAEAVVVGENLGTVSDEINELMRRWGMLGMYELQFEPAFAHQHGYLRSPPIDSVASFNTHDMPTFAGWWHGRDIETMVHLGFTSEAEASKQHLLRAKEKAALSAALGAKPSEAQHREADWVIAEDVSTNLVETFEAGLEWLGASQAEVVLVNAEDLWHEDLPQNVPGTHREVPNWRRKFSRDLGKELAKASTRRALARLDASRNEVTPEGPSD